MNSRKRWGWKRRESTSALITQKKKVKKHGINRMKAEIHEYWQMKFSQTRGRMSEVPQILILGSLEIIPTKQAVSSGALMATSPPKWERSSPLMSQLQESVTSSH